ncbi:Fe-Mn family superoxide dismutase [Paenibacillus sp. DS2015]|uniref:Fe-Mn family superoxide dismutase n=1 Tax=Paenibacillus sp. DS2015 TaxID=3373917 RepID=UPI003D263A44
MLYVYGSMLPVRILEEIRFWKTQEMEHTQVIQAIVPDLEKSYVDLLNEWAVVFQQTEVAAQKLLDQALDPSSSSSHQVIADTEQLLIISAHQSREFIRQLYLMMEQSNAIRQVELAPIVLLHIIRESEYFLAVLETLCHPGELQKHMQSPEGLIHSSFMSHIIPGEEKLAHIHAAPETPLATVKYQPVPIGGHTLPPLPYAYNALEPYIDEATMKIHHDKHHQSYVDGLNKAEQKLAEARKNGNFDLIKHWARELAFHGAGHALHTVFWEIMNPKGGGLPQGELAEQIKKDFGNFDKFKKQFSEAADKVEGGGWSILVWNPRSQHLEILQAEKHQNLTQWEAIPLLTLDVWEHAYYLKHQNQRNKYIEDWWNVVYWPAVENRYLHARQLRWQPF